MNIKIGLTSLAFSLALTAFGNSEEQPVHKTHIKSVILFDHTQSGGHVNGRKHLRDALTRLSSQYHFQLRMTEDPADITAKSLATSQILILSNGDGDVLPPGEGRTAVENFVQVDGKGLILVHAADAFIDKWTFLKNAVVQQYSRNYEPGTPARIYADTGTSENRNQGINNPETKNVFAGLPRSAILGEEYYSFRASPRQTQGVNVLLSLDESSLSNNSFPMGDHPLVWTQKMGKGIAVTHTLGHGRAAFTHVDSLGQRLLWNEMRYAAKDFMGCMDTAYAEYNPDATVVALTSADPTNPCLNPASISPVGKILGPTIQVLSHGIRVVINDPGPHRIRALQVNGKRVFESTIAGPRNKADIRGLQAGTYLVEIVAPKNLKTVKMVDLH